MDAADPVKPKRRRLTPEERIAAREAEIVAIKARQRERVLKEMDDLLSALLAADSRAKQAGMEDEAARLDAAIKALARK